MSAGEKRVKRESNHPSSSSGTKRAKKHGVKQVAGMILELCGESENGIYQDELEARLREEHGDISTESIANALNTVLQEHRLQLIRDNRANKLLYKRMIQDQVHKFKGLSASELQVYQIIQSTSNMGIWTRDLKTRSNLQQPQVAKILKTLENRKLIKSIKWVTNKNRKVYMVAEQEPSREITGGAWYTENEMDHEFIQQTMKICLHFVQRHYTRDTYEGPMLKDVTNYISRLSREGTIRIPMREEEVESIMSVLVYDGELDRVDDEEGNQVYIPCLTRAPKGLPDYLVPLLQMGWLDRDGNGTVIRKDQDQVQVKEEGGQGQGVAKVKVEGVKQEEDFGGNHHQARNGGPSGNIGVDSEGKRLFFR